MGDTELEKGALAEEALRLYFLSTGYFAVRGVPFVYRNFDVTDIDIWLYIKPTSISRERTCVDIKNKKTPQAMERVFWTKGLKEVLGVERAIVATTDNRIETREFGNMHNITVLHGTFQQRVIKSYATNDRISEEHLIKLLNTPCVVDSRINWPIWYKNSKSLLLDNLNFNGCNKFLSFIKLLLQEYIANRSSIAALRLLYIITSYYLVTLDYLSRLFSHLDADERKINLSNGFRYGDAGRERIEEIIDKATLILSESGKADLFSKNDLRGEFQKQISDYPAEVLAEYFAKPEQIKALFELSRVFESHGFAKNIIHPMEVNTELKSVFALMCDFFSINRKDVI